MPQAASYIAMVAKSERVLSKIAAKHDGVTAWEVDEAVLLTDVEDSWWDHDQARGWRLIVQGHTVAGRSLVVVLYPVDEREGIWNLGTAIRR